ncbi:ferredoxin [Methylocella silvestris BL2]|uniref:Ferredoxin n=1 Tax=Methylocella silvestris (strain DSM 15510 / CIP 108128 / LMG 27833 / NCIMB 13906 / BL2) TaxID=395965 RepID=B8EJ01_METSB|nr:PDR/VanB family oxidoreductase [Methylocella silvestris]ACK52493.1 ferredoxin [Methylocella silvestris BL2]
MSGADHLPLRVRETELISPLLKRFVFEAADGGALPPAGAGAHLRLTLEGEGRRWKNAYSIVSAPADRSHLAIIVRRVAQSRGGSAFLHETVHPGAVIAAHEPGNLFPMSHIARKHLMVSGGIGLTPFLAYLKTIEATGADFELRHFCRDEEIPTFERMLSGFDAGKITIHPASAPFDLSQALAAQPLGTHLYTCGPEPLMELVLSAARDHGWPASKLHSESFGGAHAGGLPFTAILKKSGLQVAVRDDQTLLEAIEEAGLEPDCLCRGGACGVCLTNVLEGEPDHRDHFLGGAERASNRSIMICVSRAKTQTIVLDL